MIASRRWPKAMRPSEENHSPTPSGPRAAMWSRMTRSSSLSAAGAALSWAKMPAMPHMSGLPTDAAIVLAMVHEDLLAPDSDDQGLADSINADTRDRPTPSFGLDGLPWAKEQRTCSTSAIGEQRLEVGNGLRQAVRQLHRRRPIELGFGKRNIGLPLQRIIRRQRLEFEL